MSWTNLGNKRWPYKKGLVDLGDGAYAWLAPDGSWGWSNAGLIIDGDQSLLVDTLFDLPLTREMLDAMRKAEPRAATRVDTLVNTHANGDHCYGNQLVEGAEIIASRATADEMGDMPPQALEQMVKTLGDQDSKLGHFVRRAFGPFDFSGIDVARPTQTFETELELHVGDKLVQLMNVGPAHTRGDVLAYVPKDGIIFTGDILFVEGTPIIWAGPTQNWIDACDRILGLELEAVVPGHGPITDKRGVEAVKAYLVYVRDEARKRYDAGMDRVEAAKDIALSDFSSWGDAERIVVNVASLYREFSGDETPLDTAELVVQMAELA